MLINWQINRGRHSRRRTKDDSTRGTGITSQYTLDKEIVGGEISVLLLLVGE